MTLLPCPFATTTARVLALLGALSAFAVGCGGGGGGPGGPGGGGMLPGGGQLTWLDDGVRQNATFATAALTRSTLMDFLQIAGGNSNGVGISFGVAAAPPIQTGTVSCGGQNGQYPFASFAYDPGAEPVFTSCSVTVSTLVVTGSTRVTGTFEAVFPKTGGGTKMLTAGTYDLAMTVTSLTGPGAAN